MLIDVHCHILPGLDDGATNYEQSLRMLQMAQEQGIRKIIATPHYTPRHKCASPDTVRKKADELQAAADQRGIDIRIYAGNEIFYHAEVPDLLEDGKILTLADSDIALLEFSPAVDATYVRNAVSEVQSAGFEVMIAHVERYDNLFHGKNLDKIKELHDMGALLQVNTTSLTGGMGSSVKRQVKRMLTEQLIDVLGTDAHDTDMRAPQFTDCFRSVLKNCPDDYVQRICYENANLYTIEKSLE